MKILSGISFILFAICHSYGQNQAPIIGDHYKGAPIGGEISKNAIWINRDSALMYIEGKLYTINEFDRLDHKKTEDMSFKLITNPDSIARFTTDKRIKYLVYFSKPEE